MLFPTRDGAWGLDGDNLDTGEEGARTNTNNTTASAFT